MEHKAPVFEIKRFAVHDGNGIRTTVFLKGCPLRCKWCHNPEGLTAKLELAYHKHKCISCGECLSVCPSGAHSIGEWGEHIFDRKKCTACGRCEEVCLGRALILYGKMKSVEELMPILLEDKEFYESSNGGVTLSGGECLIWADFCAELLERLKALGINTAVDTCGCVDRSALDKVIPYADAFLYDIKAYDETVHIKCTGKSNAVILENLRYLDEQGKDIYIRIPFVPNYNDGEIEKIAIFLSALKNIKEIKLLAYHDFIESKYLALDIPCDKPSEVPTLEQMQQAKEVLLKYCDCKVE